jgi:hypothetical protein
MHSNLFIIAEFNGVLNVVKNYPEFKGKNAELIEQYKKYCRLAGKK